MVGLELPDKNSTTVSGEGSTRRCRLGDQTPHLNLQLDLWASINQKKNGTKYRDQEGKERGIHESTVHVLNARQSGMWCARAKAGGSSETSGGDGEVHGLWRGRRVVNLASKLEREREERGVEEER